MNTTATFPGFETLVKPFKFAPSPYEYKVTALRECPTPETLQQCETPDKAAAGKWAVLDKDNKPVRHFDHGYMENVEFEVVRNERVGCGQKPYSAIATGHLRENYHGGQVSGFHNLAFDGTAMIGRNYEIITKAKAIRMFPERRALYLPI